MILSYGVVITVVKIFLLSMHPDSILTGGGGGGYNYFLYVVCVVYAMILPMTQYDCSCPDRYCGHFSRFE